MNTVTSADSSYYAANTNEKTEKCPCLAMTLYGVIGLKRLKCCIYIQHLTNTTRILHLHASKCRLQNQAVSSLPMHNPTVSDLPINNLPGYIQNLHVTGTSYITTNPMLHSHATSHYWYINIHSHACMQSLTLVLMQSPITIHHGSAVLS